MQTTCEPDQFAYTSQWELLVGNVPESNILITYEESQSSAGSPITLRMFTILDDAVLGFEGVDNEVQVQFFVEGVTEAL
jgi:hypothetical protein